MRLIKTTIPFIVLIICAISVSAAGPGLIPNGNPTSANPLSGALKTNASDVANAEDLNTNNGAMPEPTLAEQQMKVEGDFQKSLFNVKSSVTHIEKRINELRKLVTAPSAQDMLQLKRDLDLADTNLQKISPTGLSPLAQEQWSELSDWIFAIKVLFSMIEQRWDSGSKVFGMSFFEGATSAEAQDKRPVPENYCIRIGDKLSVSIFSQLGAKDEYILAVDDTGCIALSGIGKTAATGKTASQLGKILTQKLNSKFKQLRVQVSVSAMAAIRVQVSGEVSHPGTYTLSGISTVLNALYAAGGPINSASFRRVSLVSDNGPKRTIDLYDFFLNGNKKQDLPLKDGDLVFVPSVGQTVVVSGEVVRPGRYEPTFPVTLGNILKMAGGAKSGGFLQAVQVERVVNNEYKVLLSETLNVADGKIGFAIQPGDEITVSLVRPDKTSQVSISGPVKAPGLYGFQENMRLADLVKMAQGFVVDKEIYGGRADIIRNDSMNGASIISINLDKALKNDGKDNIVLQNMDNIFIYEPDQVVFRPKLVTISGAVARPGTYKRSSGMKVSDAIAAAGGVLPSAHLERIDLMRLDIRENPSLIRVNLQAALNGDPEANIILSDRDRLMVYTHDEVVWRDERVQIEGAVQRPGTYIRSEGMKVSDLLFAAGGLLPEAASTLELAYGGNSSVSKITKIPLGNGVINKDADVLLNDRDVVTVPALNVCLRSPSVIYLTGEVVNPGPYVLTNPSEKLADVINRAGGLTESADLNGLMFLRRKSGVENPQQIQDSDAIFRKTRLFADKQFLMQLAKSGVTLPPQLVENVTNTRDDLAKPTETTMDQIPSKIQDTSSDTSESRVSDTKNNANDKVVISTALDSSVEKPDVITAMGSRLQVDNNGKPIIPGKLDYTPSYATDYTLQSRDDMPISKEGIARISVNLGQALKDNKSADNINLRDGDRVYVPKVTNVVTVIGAVLHPHSFAAGTGNNINYYIERSGGFSQEASRRNVVVVRTNGDALSMRAAKMILPGDIIVVPTVGLMDITNKLEKVGGVTKILSDVLSAAFVLTKF
ncbi:MAG: SLBB domain-containing protein [Armatimonadetes bacterium]|nr:SLBB domain-containing protein [Armatimonadota bacterium]